MIKRKLKALIIAVAACLGTAFLGAGVAYGDSGGADSTRAPRTDLDSFVQEMGKSFIDNQSKLMDLKGWILEQADQATSGYIDQINDAATLSTRLLWYGSDPFLQIVVKKAESMGIKVSVEQRSMSLSQIDDVAKLVFLNADALARQGFILHGVGAVGVEDDGLEIVGVYTDQLAAPEGRPVPPGTQSARTTFANSVAALVGEPVTLKEGTTTPTYTRSMDSSAFYAGGYMIKSGGGVCSTGFALRYSGQTYITTARHCRGTYSQRDSSPLSNAYGSNYLYSSDGGASLLNSRGSERMFDGAWNDSTGFNKGVSGFKDVSLNDAICTSGGNSGVHCYVKVTQMRYMWDDGYGSFANIVAVQQKSGQIAAIGGDSGGPVLFPNSDGSVGAVGMMQAAGASASNCGSVHDSGNVCSATVYFSSIRTIANAFGATLITG